MRHEGGDQFMRKSGGTRAATVRWSPQEDEVLSGYLKAEVRIRDIAHHFPGRTDRSIECRLWRLRNPPQRREAENQVLFEQILAFCCRHNLSQRQFGAMAVGSPGFVGSMRKGRHIGEPLETRLREFMARGDPRPRTFGSRIVAAQRKTNLANQAAEAKAQMFRETDPHEQAKTFIRRQGFACFNAEILKPQARGRFYIGANQVSADELLAFARRRGWEG